MSLLDRLKKTSKIDGADTFGKAKFITSRQTAPTRYLPLNIALGGDLSGGVRPGLHQIAGPSRHFKSNLGLALCSAYMKKYPDSIMLFYDSEFGSKDEYFKFADIDPDRVLHGGVKDIEQLKRDIVTQVDELNAKTENVIIFIDSIGNLASKKEVSDALNDNDAADMTRAKQLKSLWRILTPYLHMKGIPCIAINHTYESMAMYGGPTVSGGCVVAGTKIHTSKGLKEIENIEVGDLVETKNGLHEVTSVWNPETLINGTPECFEIEFEDGYKVVCSADHKFIVNGEWVEAKFLKSGDDTYHIE